MSDRLEKLFTLTEIDNPPEAPVTIEAGGLIKDNKTGRVIARMYLKNCSDKPLSSVLVGFKPQGENGRAISGMRDYLYDASGVPVGEIFGDQTGIFFDNNETKSFTAGVAEVDFEDGEYWDAVEAAKKAAELKLIVPAEKEKPEEVPEAWSKPVEQQKAPEVWESESHEDEKHSAEIYGAAIAGQKYEEPEEEFVPASLETRQLGHEERPVLEEETDAYKEDQAKAVIELDGPSEDEGTVIELGGPAEGENQEQPEAEEPEAVEERTEEPAEEAPEEVTAEAEPEEEEAEEELEQEEPQGPVRLGDMYGGVAAASGLASLAAIYGMRNKEQAAPEEPETAVEEEASVSAEPETQEAEPEVEEPAEPDVETEEPAAEESETEAEVEVAPEEPVAEEEPTPVETETHKAFNTEDIENPWAGYSADYAPPLGAIQKKAEEEPEAPEAEAEAEPEAATEEEPVITEEMQVETEALKEPEPEPEAEPAEAEAAPEAEPVEAEPEPEKEAVPEEAAPEEAPAEEEIVLPEAEEHIPTIEETIELPKATVPEKSADDAEEILAAAAAKAEAEAPAPEEVEEAPAEETVKPAEKKADVVFAQENDVIPSIIDDSKQKALTGEDHSGRNLLNIVVFGGIALIILLVLLIKM